MVENTNIEWCDHTLNPWEGCMAVASECDNCYAQARDHRFTGGKHWGPKAPRRRTSPQTWNKARKWNRAADAFYATHGRRQRVFCASLADVFDNAVDPEWRADLWALIHECDKMDWLLLTKRPQNIVRMLPTGWLDGWSHVWLGTSAGSQETANKNIPALLRVPAAVRFVSCEPMLGSVDLSDVCNGWYFANWLAGTRWHDAPGIFSHERGQPHLDWVICGGESGPNARPMHPDWARSLRDQCEMACVPFLFKQWGEWAPGAVAGPNKRSIPCATWWNDAWEVDIAPPSRPDDHIDDEPDLFRIGKKAAGRLLDGVTHDEFPALDQ